MKTEQALDMTEQSTEQSTNSEQHTINETSVQRHGFQLYKNNQPIFNLSISPITHNNQTIKQSNNNQTTQLPIHHDVVATRTPLPPCHSFHADRLLGIRARIRRQRDEQGNGPTDPESPPTPHDQRQPPYFPSAAQHPGRPPSELDICKNHRYLCRDVRGRRRLHWWRLGCGGSSSFGDLDGGGHSAVLGCPHLRPALLCASPTCQRRRLAP